MKDERMPKRAYETPTLTRYGSVTCLTQGGAGSGNDGGRAYMNMGMAMGMSDIRCKRDLTRIGTHPLGFGLYLFRYKEPYATPADCDLRQFGVVAQEVEPIVPAAVLTDARGLKYVDYARLGILRQARSPT